MRDNNHKLTFHHYLINGLLLVTIFLTSCNSKGRVEVLQLDTPAEAVEQETIKLTKAQFDAGQMKLGKITPQPFHKIVKANGQFEVPPQNQVDVSAYFEGYVKELKLLPGEYVKKGAVLFTIENPSYVQVQQDFLEAKGRLNFLQSNYERQKELLADNVTSKKNFLKAEADYNVTKTQYESLKKKLSLMRINSSTLKAENMQSIIPVIAPISGYVTSIKATKGMFLNPSDVALTITNTNDLHISLKIYEQDLPLVKEGQIVHVRLQNDTDNVYMGKVHLVNKTISPEERTIEVHADLVNKSDAKLFAPGMYIEGEIITTSSEFPALPIDAVVAIDNDYFVLERLKDLTFSQRLVKVGQRNNDYVQIVDTDDFKQGAEFLIKGAFNLIME
ncbi:efflux RND transporter periplasmic adaptor subunit [Flavobacteriaceae bacterium F08102]|nr:efflux RND transporter periplasmic adaptor subunit [Flavobacteriaceae bacterium F08102]